ncbi:hypothetical protein SEA_CEN1621_53 [Microbacterium phage Cen1621]|uniref:Lipoprotein n=1 Tax=Microbacterium phage Cen1621 TaxID=2965191 RepID=A0A9E7QAE7_9CAUD|nr:hypothetical protein SEA_CEN1621_53 [Microbacterium phage Cen1621]
MLRSAKLAATFAILGTLALAGCSSTTTGTPPASTEETTEEAAAETPEPAAPELGTRENPYPIGSTIEGPEWTVVVNSVALGQADAVAAANPFNEPADPGTEYIVVNYTATYTGSDAEGSMPALAQVEYVTGAGATVSGLDKLVVAPEPAMDTVSTLYGGASATGNVAIQVPSPVDGVLAVTPGLMADTAFVAVQ